MKRLLGTLVALVLLMHVGLVWAAPQQFIHPPGIHVASETSTASPFSANAAAEPAVVFLEVRLLRPAFSSVTTVADLAQSSAHVALPDARGPPRPLRADLTGSIAAGGVRPGDFGLQTVAENAEYLSIYNNTLRKLAGGNNGYSRYLKVLEQGGTPSKRVLKDAWKSVGSEYAVAMENAGHKIHATHHWNWPKHQYAEYLTDPRHLVPIPASRPAGLHAEIHRLLTSHPDPDGFFMNKVIGPVRPEDAMTLGPAQSVVTTTGR